MQEDLTEILTEDGPIRRFSDSGLDALIDMALADLPEDKHIAVVGGLHKQGVDTKIQAAILGRIGKNWSVVFAADRDWMSSDWSAQGIIRWTK